MFELLNKKKAPAEIPVMSSARFRKSCGCSSQSQNIGGRALDVKKTGDMTATEWLGKKTQFHVMNTFLSLGQNHLNLAKFRRTFKELVDRFDVSAAAVCFYFEPVYLKEMALLERLPERAFLLASYDKERNFIQNINEDPIEFNPNEKMLPDGGIDFSQGQYMAWILSNCETQYGYIVFRKGSYENLIYSMLCIELSRLASSAWESTRAEKIAKAQQESAARLNMISKTDELTGLLNRRGFMELGQQTIDIAVVLKQGGMVIFGDMDGLKYINDNFGHDAGDRAIKAEAEILKKNFRASDIVGRLGGRVEKVPGVGKFGVRRLGVEHRDRGRTVSPSLVGFVETDASSFLVALEEIVCLDGGTGHAEAGSAYIFLEMRIVVEMVVGRGVPVDDLHTVEMTVMPPGDEPLVVEAVGQEGCLQDARGILPDAVPDGLDAVLAVLDGVLPVQDSRQGIVLIVIPFPLGLGKRSIPSVEAVHGHCGRIRQIQGVDAGPVNGVAFGTEGVDDDAVGQGIFGGNPPPVQPGIRLTDAVGNVHGVAGGDPGSRIHGRGRFSEEIKVLVFPVQAVRPGGQGVLRYGEGVLRKGERVGRKGVGPGKRIDLERLQGEGTDGLEARTGP